MEFRVYEEHARNATGINVIGCYLKHNCGQESKHCRLSCFPCNRYLYVYQATQVRRDRAWNGEYFCSKLKQFMFQIDCEFSLSEKYLTCQI